MLACGLASATLMYAVQIYCDFSGYSDMAIACAGLLGYQLRINFDFPYLAADITGLLAPLAHLAVELAASDYLYIPLGGNRGSQVVQAEPESLILTLLLGGLWHGAAWHFVIWGGLHGPGPGGPP